LGIEHRRRDDTELLQALTGALALLTGNVEVDTTLRKTIDHAVAGLGAQAGVLVEVLRTDPLEVELLCSGGLIVDAQSAQELRPSSVMDTALIRQVVDDGKSRLVGDPHSALCAPVTDSLTGAVMAVLHFQVEDRSHFRTEDLEWVTAYATALGQALTLHITGRRRTLASEPEWRTTQDASGPEIVGTSVATRDLIETLKTFLPNTIRPDAPPILVTGESGTGKELVARYLHHFSPKRARGPFQTFNCAAIRGDLAEARLFGHVRGSFTGALTDAAGLFRAADRGVLFLDEIGELPPDGQALLLRILETRSVQPVGDTREVPVDVQLVLATNRNLEEEVAAHRFREDLFYRISGLVVSLVPLRDPTRIADIRVLLAFYLGKHERLLKKKTMGLTAAAFRALLQFAWPGNARQLNNVSLTLVTHAAPGAWIDIADIRRYRPEILTGPRNPNPEAYLEDENVTYSDALRAFRKKVVLDRLRRHRNNVAAASSSLGISEPTFYRYWTDAKRIP
jgi:transcriptional regulator with PAS, ATPase and Fis domain